MSVEEKLHILAQCIKDLTCIIGGSGDDFLELKLREVFEFADGVYRDKE